MSHLAVTMAATTAQDVRPKYLRVVCDDSVPELDFSPRPAMDCRRANGVGKVATDVATDVAATARRTCPAPSTG
jgi:hypothetical protein